MGNIGLANRPSIIKTVLAAICAALTVCLAVTPSWAQSGIRDTEIERIIRGYADPVLEAAGIPPKSVDIYLLNDPSINAFVTRGSDMYIHTGLLVQADRPAQVIGVIAHETGHIAGGHVARMGDAFAAAAMPMLITMGLGLIAMAAGSPDAGMALLTSGQHIAERTILRHSRIQESAADQAAVTYLTRTGQSARGLLEITEKFRHMEILSAQKQNPYVRTHPLSSDRIASLTERTKNSPYADILESKEQVFEFEMMKAKLYGFLNRPELTFYRYPASDTSMPARYARAVAYYRIPEVDKALAEIDSLIADQPNNPYFQELKGQIFFETGRAAEAIPYHNKSVELLPDAPLLRINLAQAMIATEDSGLNAAAIRHLETAILSEQENSFAWHQLAVAYARQGKIGKADLATAERHFNNRQMGPAVAFAKRARINVVKGSTHWQRAMDIIEIASTAQVERQRR
ncbi:MAG: M48 family peptidase [Alphaproteobacteria bacterium]|nr:MAG: M48 family peptidase [Alphaproteobacteria bacterium]